MKSLFRYLPVILLPLLFAGCSAQEKLVVNPEYQKSLSQNKTLGVVPFIFKIPPHSTVELQFDIKEDIADVRNDPNWDNPDIVYMNYFNNKFINDIKIFTDFDAVGNVDAFDTTLYEQKVFDISNEKINLLVPKEGITFRREFFRPDYILFIQSMIIDFDLDFPYGYWIENLCNTGKFVIWDNREGKVAMYGDFEAKSYLFNGEVYRRNWDETVTRSVYEIFKDTPFLSANLER